MKGRALLPLLLAVGCALNAPQSPPSPEGKKAASQAAKSLEKIGIDLHKPTLVEFSIEFEDAVQARSADKALRAQGFATRLQPDHDFKLWTCEARKSLTPGSDEFASAFDAVDRAVKMYKGRFLGWSADDAGH